MVRKHKIQFILTIVTLAVCPQLVHAQSRSVFKCTEGDKTVYSDAPCLGAQKIDAQPTRGLNKFNGKEATGRDVSLEKQHEAFAQAIKPISGMSADQLALAGRRSKLSAAAQQECKRLDGLIPDAERDEKNAAKNSPELKSAQAALYRLRVAYRTNICD